MSDEVLAIGEWWTNAALIADVARLPNYFEPEHVAGKPAPEPWSVLDATYGVAGGFWKQYRPPGRFVTSDLATEVMVKKVMVPVESDEHWDYRQLPLEASSFDVVVFDPPYKLNGTPALGEQDSRFGTTERTSRSDVLTDIVTGAVECYRVCARRLFVKCMDQVEGGIMRWQTDLITRAVEAEGGRKMDRFDIPSAGREQPKDRKCPTCGGTGDAAPEDEAHDALARCLDCGGKGRVPIVQRTSRGKHSTLLVFAKPARSR